MISYAFINYKGGVSKSVSSVNVASILQHKGYKVLLIDADPQTNASDTYRAVIDGEATLYDCWLERGKHRENIMDCIQHTEIGDIVAGDPLINEADSKLNNASTGVDMTTFKEMLDSVEGYDYVIVDCPPAIGAISKRVMAAVDKLVVPVVADRYAIKGIQLLWDTFQDVKENFNPKVQIEGILLAMFDTRTNNNKEIYSSLVEIADALDTKVFNSYIRTCSKVKEAQARRQTLINYAPKCTACEDYLEFVDELIG